MIQVKNITKIFNSKKKDKCVALDNVSFTLPDSGFVFINGKSGSGKTTLLSLIGGLDNITSGEIIVDNINIKKLKGTKFDYYRNNKIGFIFQDYQLFDELTVYENIKLALNFINNNDFSIIDKVLEAVNLKGYGSRYPKELSGGEKQRVAIARILAKNPSIILADEPTGNLDADTTKEILKILKNISKSRLVLIVSHNILDSHAFADYILELSYGKLIGTYKRNENNKSIEIKDNILFIPLHKELNETDVNDVLNNINNIIEVKQNDNDFINCELNNDNDTNNVELNKKHITFFNAFKKGLKFLKNGRKPLFIFSLIIATLFSLINISEAFVSINGNNIIEENYKQYDYDYVPLIDVNLENPSYYNHILSYEDNKAIKENYNGKIYDRYSITSCSSSLPLQYNGNKLSYVTICDEEYITNRFNNLDYIIRSDNEKPYGAYITDFYCDYINNTDPQHKTSYDNFLEYKYFDGVYINGIIKTDYNMKYKTFLPIIFENFPGMYELHKELYKKDKKLFNDFYYDANNYFFSFISFNQNFINDYIYNTNTIYDKVTSILSNKDKSTSKDKYLFKKRNYNAISENLYSYLTGKTINFNNENFKKIEPIKLNCQVYSGNDKSRKRKSYTFEIDLVEKTETNNKIVLLNPIEYPDFFKNEILKLISLVVKDKNQIHNLRNQGIISEHIVIHDNIDRTLELTLKLTNVFGKIFFIIFFLLLASSIAALIFYSTRLVNKNMKLIGVCKSLGARTKDLIIILTCNLLIMLTITIFEYLLISNIIFNIINNGLIRSIFFATSYSISIKTKILLNNSIFVNFNILLIIALSLISFFALFIKINNLKPIELIKKQE